MQTLCYSVKQTGFSDKVSGACTNAAKQVVLQHD